MRLSCLALLLSFSVTSGILAAETPVVVFDVAQSLSCRVIQKSAEQRKSSGTRLIEVVASISVHLPHGEEVDVKHLSIEIVSPDQRHAVKCFLPSTELTTDIVEGIVLVEETKLSGEAAVSYLVVPRSAQAEAKGHLHESKVTFKRLAPRQLLVASGTIERSHGVSYKLCRSEQQTLQRQWEFSIVLEVPEHFRADYLTARCKAIGTKHGLISALDSEVVVGQGEFAVGVFVDGDDEAKRASEALSKAQQKLFDALFADREEIRQLAESERTLRDFLWQVLVIILSDTRLAAGSFSPAVGPEIARGLASGRIKEEQLPSDLLRELKGFEDCKLHLRSLSGL